VGDHQAWPLSLPLPSHGACSARPALPLPPSARRPAATLSPRRLRPARLRLTRAPRKPSASSALSVLRPARRPSNAAPCLLATGHAADRSGIWRIQAATATNQPCARWAPSWPRSSKKPTRPPGACRPARWWSTRAPPATPGAACSTHAVAWVMRWHADRAPADAPADAPANAPANAPVRATRY
jgi:hypothetical protein